MKKILVPTDFSENAFVALEYAQKIASQKGFEVIVLHAFLPFHSGFQSEEANQADRLRFRRELEGEFTMLKDKLSKNQAPTELVTRSVEGNLRQSVNAICDAEEVALIVMGTKGASGMIGQMLGSNTLDIARSAPAPILIVPPQGIPKNIEKVLFLTDYQKQDRNTLSDLVSVFG